MSGGALGDRLAQRGAEPRVGRGVVAVGEGAVRVEAVRQAVGVDRADAGRSARSFSAPSATPSQATTRCAETNSPSPPQLERERLDARAHGADARGERDVVARPAERRVEQRHVARGLGLRVHAGGRRELRDAPEQRVDGRRAEHDAPVPGVVTHRAAGRPRLVPTVPGPPIRRRGRTRPSRPSAPSLRHRLFVARHAVVVGRRRIGRRLRVGLRASSVRAAAPARLRLGPRPRRRSAATGLGASSSRRARVLRRRAPAQLVGGHRVVVRELLGQRPLRVLAADRRQVVGVERRAPGATASTPAPRGAGSRPPAPPPGGGPRPPAATGVGLPLARQQRAPRGAARRGPRSRGPGTPCPAGRRASSRARRTR